VPPFFLGAAKLEERPAFAADSDRYTWQQLSGANNDPYHPTRGFVGFREESELKCALMWP
jgi:hypothetical protein